MSAARASLQAAKLLSALLRLPKPDVILVQNPPAVPTLAAAWTAARLRGARLVIDWHNLSHTMLAVRLGERHRAVQRFAAERAALGQSRRRTHRRVAGPGRLAAARVAAQGDGGLRPPDRVFRQALARSRQRAVAAARARPATSARGGFRIVVCPTSWTLDEDFDLLLEALERTERSLDGQIRKADDAARRTWRC